VNQFAYYKSRRLILPTVVNTPNNPSGKVFTLGELEDIAGIAKEFNLMVMSDEVVREST
jgi:aspartate/methionine/tyrosine aminotransferase